DAGIGTVHHYLNAVLHAGALGPDTASRQPAAPACRLCRVRCLGGAQICACQENAGSPDRSRIGMKKHILVTGGAGFVGSHLVDALLAAGHSVRVLDNLTPQVHGEDVPDYLSPEAELVCGDMRDSDAVRDALEGIEVVFHLAAAVGVGQSMYEIAQYVGANTQGTAVLLQELLGRRSRVEKLVLASSMSVYGEGKYVCALCGETAPALRSLTQLKSKQWETLCRRCSRVLSPIPTDESKPLQSSSIYSLSKRSQEEMCLLFGRTYSLPVVALRYFNIYGPRQA